MRRECAICGAAADEDDVSCRLCGNPLEDAAPHTEERERDTDYSGPDIDRPQDTRQQPEAGQDPREYGREQYRKAYPPEGFGGGARQNEPYGQQPSDAYPPYTYPPQQPYGRQTYDYPPPGQQQYGYPPPNGQGDYSPPGDGYPPPGQQAYGPPNGYPPPYGYPPGQPPYGQPYGHPYRSRITAGLLAIFLGIFGVHKFYLGKIGMGILYAIFFWTFIPMIIGFIEGIVYLAEDEYTFMQRYNRE